VYLAADTPYNVTETIPSGSGYVGTFSEDCSSSTGFRRPDEDLHGDHTAPPHITVTKTADPTSVPETGGDVTFTFDVLNDGPSAVTITALTDDKFGVLAGDADCQWNGSGGWRELLLHRDLRDSCGDTGGSHVNVFTATAKDSADQETSDTDDATVTTRTCCRTSR